MKDFIEREAAINKRRRVTEYDEAGFSVTYSGVPVEEIEKIPAADVVEVVRCKDCKHYHEKEGWCDKHSHFVGSEGEACHPWESNDWKMFEPDDFCSYGERRTNDV